MTPCQTPVTSNYSLTAKKCPKAAVTFHHIGARDVRKQSLERRSDAKPSNEQKRSRCTGNGRCRENCQRTPTKKKNTATQETRDGSLGRLRHLACTRRQSRCSRHVLRIKLAHIVALHRESAFWRVSSSSSCKRPHLGARRTGSSTRFYAQIGFHRVSSTRSFAERTQRQISHLSAMQHTVSRWASGKLPTGCCSVRRRKDCSQTARSRTLIFIYRTPTRKAMANGPANGGNNEGISHRFVEKVLCAPRDSARKITTVTRLDQGSVDTQSMTELKMCGILVQR